MYPAKNKLFNALSLNVKLQIKFVNHPEGTENRSLTILWYTTDFRWLSHMIPITNKAKLCTLTSSWNDFCGCNMTWISLRCSFKRALMWSSFLCLPDKALIPILFFFREGAPVVNDFCSVFTGTGNWPVSCLEGRAVEKFVKNWVQFLHHIESGLRKG